MSEQRQQILAQLRQIEREEQVRIIYACESGSRAWGFPSKDSDYDVRFIYVRPVDWYLSIFEKGMSSSARSASCLILTAGI